MGHFPEIDEHHVTLTIINYIIITFILYNSIIPTILF